MSASAKKKNIYICIYNFVYQAEWEHHSQPGGANQTPAGAVRRACLWCFCRSTVLPIFLHLLTLSPLFPPYFKEQFCLVKLTHLATWLICKRNFKYLLLRFPGRYSYRIFDSAIFSTILLKSYPRGDAMKLLWLRGVLESNDTL